MRKNRVPLPQGLGLACSNIQSYYKLRPEIMRDLGLSVSNILDLSVFDGKAGSSLIVYTKFERVGLNDRQTDRQTNRQTDR